MKEKTKNVLTQLKDILPPQLAKHNSKHQLSPILKKCKIKNVACSFALHLCLQVENCVCFSVFSVQQCEEPVMADTTYPVVF